ncbi:MAG: LysE family transporter [Dehalococcoidales bacterium]|jgi:threonine/homoserine/homoserine lactone efflux protein
MPEATLLIIFSTSFVVALSGALMPGPLLALTISQATQHGFWAGPLLILGHAVLELVIVVALLLGLRQFNVEGTVSGIIGISGGTVLVVMGLGILARGRHKMTMPTANPPTAGQNRKGIIMGILGSAANPYFFIWWATIGTSYLLWSLELGFSGVASFFTGHILADLGWYTLVAFIITSGKKVISDTVYHWIFIVCGLVLVGLGGRFIFSGAGYLIG